MELCLSCTDSLIGTHTLDIRDAGVLPACKFLDQKVKGQHYTGNTWEQFLSACQSYYSVQ